MSYAALPVAKVPYDPIAESESKLLEYGVEKRIKRDYLSVVHEVADLPAKRALGMKNSHTFTNETFLRFTRIVS